MGTPLRSFTRVLIQDRMSFGPTRNIDRSSKEYAAGCVAALGVQHCDIWEFPTIKGPSVGLKQEGSSLRTPTKRTPNP